MIRLGWRLAMVGGRGVMAVMVATVAVGTTLLLFALTVAPALQSRADRTAWMDVGTGASARYVVPPGAEPLRTTITTSSDKYRRSAIDVVSVAGSGPGAPAPPGLAGLPGRGEVVVSPALLRLMAKAPVLADRYGRVVGTIEDSALGGPEALVAVRGVTESEVAAAYGIAVTGFPLTGEALELTGLLRLLLRVGTVAMLAPVFLLVVMATRLTAATRSRRLAALRLAGATTGQVARLAGVESLAVGGLGVLVGAGLLLLLRPAASRLTYDGDRWFPQDVTPGPGALAAVLVVVPLVTALATQVTLTQVARSPLGLSRRAGARPVRWWRVLPLGLAVPLLGVVVASDQAMTATGGRSRLIMLSFSVLLITLVYAGPWFTRTVGLALARSAGPARLLAGRRLADDPRSGFRAVVGVILAIFITTVFVSTTPGAAQSLESVPVLAQSIGSAQVGIGNSTPAEARRLLRDAQAVPGVTGAALVYEGDVPQGEAGPVLVWIGDCAAITRAARLASVRCDQAPVVVARNRQHLVRGPGARFSLNNLSTVGNVPGAINALTLTVPAVSTMPAQVGIDVPGLIISPSVLGSKMASLRPTLILVRYDDAAALEQVRNLMFGYVPDGSLQTRETSFDGYSEGVRHLYRVVTIATVGIFATAGLGLVVAVAIGLVERRRPFALLRAAGTPLSTLRRTVFLEAAVPLLLMSTLAALLGAFVGWSLVARSAISAPLSLVGLIGPTAAGVLVCLLVIAGALPMVGRATATEETRFE
jgi:hypothetical protein